jgi:hypothetical protein
MLDGRPIGSPSEAAHKVTGRNVNGWRFWECRLPGETRRRERKDDSIGPYCREDSCNITSGIFVGDDKFPVKLFVALKDGMIYVIEVSFNTIFWNDIWDIIVKKYGPAWEIQRDTIGVMDYETKRSINLSE